MNSKENIKEDSFNDLQSFDEIVLRYRENSINFARRYVKDLQICEDIVQEAFASVFVYRDKYNPDMSFKTWLFSIIHNKCVDYLRKNRELLSYSIEAESRECGTFENLDTKIILEQEIGRLKPNYRAIIQMIEVEGMTIREAAKVLQISYICIF
ncbi:MAG: RNA polymerase sigma factor [Clostridiaceae bacterium]|jgi:RNA polymerase sigma factor (sigma-70 family)|nr:RNA polymerase sigma factor [Clostridiaceae bacterium]